MIPIVTGCLIQRKRVPGVINGLITAGAISDTEAFVTAEEEARIWIEWTVIGIEALAVVIVIIAIPMATSQFLFTRQREVRFTLYRHNIGRALLLVLEILIAADIVRTVILNPTLESAGVLGLLVVMRTFLSRSLVVDIEGHWPWQPKR